MWISVFGLGYVGSVSAACLARDGHEVIGVDSHEGKVNLFKLGQSPIVEPGLDALIQTAVAGGKLAATTNSLKAIEKSQVSIVCVGTPSKRNGSLETKYIQRVCAEIGTGLREKSEFHVVVMRSTMLPGTMQKVVIPELERASGKKAGHDFGICINPEFLRESTAIFDYDNPPKIVIGSSDRVTASLVASLFEHLPAPLIKTSIEVAEAVKYTDNAWHAVKVDFANEIGTLCNSLSVDGQEVMEIFRQDQKLNISTYYLRPGFAFGGSCLPKDVRALTYLARTLGLKLPMLESVLPSNEEHILRAIESIEVHGRRNIGVLGISFKAHTDDLRESPTLRVVEQLHGRGYAVRIYDPTVSHSVLTGANRQYMLDHLPHIFEMLTDDQDELLKHAQILVVGNSDNRYQKMLGRAEAHHSVLDLASLGEPTQSTAYAAA